MQRRIALNYTAATLNDNEYNVKVGETFSHSNDKCAESLIKCIKNDSRVSMWLRINRTIYLETNSSQTYTRFACDSMKI